MTISMGFREATLVDSPIVLKERNHPDVIKNSRNLKEITFEEHVSWFNERLSHNEIFIYEINNTPVGVVSFTEIDSKLYWSFYLFEAFRNRKLSYWLTRAVLTSDVLKEKLKNTKQLFAKVLKENSRSKKIHESIGFILDGESDGVLDYRLEIK